MSALTPRDRRALWLGAITLSAALLWRAVVLPVASSVAQAEARAEAAAGLLAREHAIVRDAPAVPARLAAVRRQFDSVTTRLFVANDTVGAQQALIGALRSAASRAGLTEFRAESAPATAPAGGLLALQMELRGRASTRALAAWLAALERSERLVMIERLDVAVDGDNGLAVSATVRALARVGDR